MGADLRQTSVRVSEKPFGVSYFTFYNEICNAFSGFLPEFFCYICPALSDESRNIIYSYLTVCVILNILHTSIYLFRRIPRGLHLCNPVREIKKHVILQHFNLLCWGGLFTLLDIQIDKAISLFNSESAADSADLADHGCYAYQKIFCLTQRRFRKFSLPQVRCFRGGGQKRIQFVCLAVPYKWEEHIFKLICSVQNLLVLWFVQVLGICNRKLVSYIRRFFEKLLRNVKHLTVDNKIQKRGKVHKLIIWAIRNGIQKFRQRIHIFFIR